MKNLKNEEAVSPVIGVILMVVITVIIAAIMAVFAFGVGAPDQTPQTSVKISGFVPYVNATANTNVVSIVHNGGTQIKLSDLKLVVEQTSISGALVSRETITPSGPATTAFAAGDRIDIDLRQNQLFLNGVAIALVGPVFNPTLNNTVMLTAGNTVTVQAVYIPTDSIMSAPKVNI